VVNETAYKQKDPCRRESLSRERVEGENEGKGRRGQSANHLFKKRLIPEMASNDTMTVYYKLKGAEGGGRIRSRGESHGRVRGEESRGVLRW